MLSSIDLPQAQRPRGGDHETPLCHDGGQKIDSAMRCESTGQDYLRTVSWLCFATQTPATRARHDCPVGDEAVGEAIMTLLSVMTEAKKSTRQCFARQLVKVIFVLSPVYASLPKTLQFVYAIVVLFDGGTI